MAEQFLVPIPSSQTALQVFTADDGTAPLIARVRQEVENFVADASTVKGRAEIKSFAFNITKTKAALETVGKALAAEQKLIPGKIDACRRTTREAFEALHDQVRRPLTEWEEAEKGRKDRHMAEVARIAAPAAPGSSSAHIRARLAEADAVVIGEGCEEFELEYARAKDIAIRDLRVRLIEAEQEEARQAELERLRAEAAARAAQDHEDRIRAEAVEAERTRAACEAEAEKARAEAAARAERDAAESRERGLRLAAEAAERRAAETEARVQREADEEIRRAEAEAARREADNRRRGKVHRDALADLVAGGIDEEVARTVVALIARRSVAHIAITY